MDIGSILAITISLFVFLYTVFRDNSKDTADLLNRVSQIERKVAVQEISITSMGDEVSNLRSTLRNLEVQMHEIDLKVERILTILEK